MSVIKRGDLIRKEDVGKEFSLPTGLVKDTFVVTEGMEGHCFGEFKPTKKIGSIHVKKKKRKKK